MTDSFPFEGTMIYPESKYNKLFHAVYLQQCGGFDNRMIFKLIKGLFVCRSIIDSNAHVHDDGKQTWVKWQV